MVQVGRGSGVGGQGSIGEGGGVIWLGRGSNTLKSFYQPILRHPNFCDMVRQTSRPTY